MVSADGASREIPLKTLPVVLGRGEECKLRIPIPAVSRRHCEIRIEDDELVVKDLKSANGTYVNGMKVLSRELVPGDLLALGSVVFVVRLNGHPKTIDARECFAAGSVEPRDQAAPPRPSLGDSSMIEGVPAWNGDEAPAAPGKPAKSAKSSKPADDDDDGLDSLLADLDLSGLDDDEDEKPARK